MDLPAVKELLAKALENPHVDLERLSAEQLGATPEVVAEVERLLAASRRMPAILRAETLADALGLAEENAGGAHSHEDTPLVAGRYLLEELLATSPQSVVYRARDTRLADAPVVVKLLRGQGLGLESLRMLLRAEIEALARLRHPGVAGLVDEGVTDTGQVYAVMQYIPGDSLRTLMRKGAVDPDVAQAVLVQASDIVDAAHQAGIVHCDLKPENIIVNFRPGGPVHVSVVDFGIALTKPRQQDSSPDRDTNTPRPAPAQDAMPLFRGTPVYCAPEQLRGEPGARSDVYALAQVARELFPHAKGQLLRVIQDAAAADPDRRPATAGAFVQALVKVRARRAQRRRFAVAATAVALLLSVAVFIGRERWRSQTPLPVELRRLTNLKGVEMDAAFSPDGKRLYFAQGAGQQEDRKLFVFALESEGAVPLALTNGPGSDARPTLSPDGRWLAYLHREGALPAELRVMPAPGGATRTLYRGEIQSLAFGPVPDALYFTEWVQPADVGVIHRISITTGTTEAYPAPPEFRGDIDVAISPDGKSMLFARYRMLESADFYLQSLDAEGRPLGEARRVTFLDQRVFRPSWYPDSRQLVFVAGTLSNRTLHKLDLRGSTPVVREFPEFGDHLEQVTISPDGSRMAVVRSLEDSDIWQFFLAPDGGPDPERRPRRVFSSTSLDEEAAFAPDGRIAFFSERASGLQAWLADGEASAPRVLSQLRHAEKAWLAWSPAGRLSVFCRMPGAGPVLHQLEPGTASPLKLVFSATSKDRVVGISRDGDSLYVVPEDRADLRLERWGVHAGTRELVARVEAGFLKESGDGRWLYYTRRHEGEGLFRIPREGGAEVSLVAPLSRRNTFDVHGQWIYYVSPTPEMGLYRAHVENGRRELIYALDRIPGWGLDVAPDGRSLLLPLYDFDDADIFLSDRLP